MTWRVYVPPEAVTAVGDSDWMVAYDADLKLSIFCSARETAIAIVFVEPLPWVTVSCSCVRARTPMARMTRENITSMRLNPGACEQRRCSWCLTADLDPFKGSKLTRARSTSMKLNPTGRLELLVTVGVCRLLRVIFNM